MRPGKCAEVDRAGIAETTLTISRCTVPERAENLIIHAGVLIVRDECTDGNLPGRIADRRQRNGQFNTGPDVLRVERRPIHFTAGKVHLDAIGIAIVEAG